MTVAPHEFPAAARPAPPSGNAPAWVRAGWGPLLFVAGLAVALLFCRFGQVALLAAAALFAVAGLMIGFERPGLLPAALLLIGPFNYGFNLGGASIKLSELVAFAMLGVILLRLAARDGQMLARLRRAGAPLVCLALLGVMAVATALPHPNFFNVRYELEIYIFGAYMILFFRRGWWRGLLWAALTALLMESVLALALKFVFGLTGTSFFDVGGVKLIALSAEDLEGLAGGRFRLSGTFGHKNMLAAFYVLTLPVVCLEALHRGRWLWLGVILPALATLALTDSMTGWSAFVLIAALVLLHLRRFDYLLFIALFLLPVGAFVLYQFGDSVFFRVGQLTAGKEGIGTVNSRHEIWQISQALLAQYPWLGIGRANFLSYGKTFYGHAHNLFVMKAIEMGIPAGIAFGLFIVGLMARTWWALVRGGKRLAAGQQYYRALGLWLGCLGFVAMNLFDYNYQHYVLGPMFMAMLGILLAVGMDLESLPAMPGPSEGGS